VREPESLCIHVENEHGHQFRQYQALFALLGHRVFALGDPEAPPPDLVVAMLPRQDRRLCSEAPVLASVHNRKRLDALAGRTPEGMAMAARHGHWLVKREADAAALRDAYGVETAVAPYYYPDLAGAGPPDPARPVALLCASYINRYDRVGRGRGFERFELVRQTLGEGCAWYGAGSAHGVVVDDAVAFRRARFTLNLKHWGYVCNAVVRSLCAGVPVVMDRRSFEIGRYEGFLAPRCGLVVLDTVHEIAAFVRDLPAAPYAALSREADESAARFRRPPQDLSALDALLRRCAATARLRPAARPSRAPGSARTRGPAAAG